MKVFCAKCNCDCEVNEKVIGGFETVTQYGDYEFIPTLINYICVCCNTIIKATFNGRDIY
jgi:hypothetical protein